MVLEVLGQDEALTRLEEVGIATPAAGTGMDAEAAAAAAAELPGPWLVLKAGGLLHKTDDGGVVLGLEGPGAVRTAAEDLLARLGDGALPLVVQEQFEGVEVLVGLRRVPQLGTALVVGAGGVLTEVLQDVQYESVPVDVVTARAMLDRLRIRPLLDGVRGGASHDVDALVAAMVAVSQLAERHPDIAEMDLNPIMVGSAGQGVRAVDVRVLVDRPQERLTVRAVRDLDRLLAPRSVAVVGVSDDRSKVGTRLFGHLVTHGFPGALHPIHPSGGTIDGHRRARSLRELGSAPDLVCIAVPAQHVPAVAQEAVEVGAGSVLVHSSDFAEIGDRGRRLQDELAAVLAAGGVPLAGPNDMGIVAPHQGLAASISGALSRVELRAGSVALVSSSGALGSCLATRLLEHGVGLSHWIHAGNEADVTIAEYLRWLVDDAATGAVGLLLEDIKDGPTFAAATQELNAAGKPVFAYHMVRTASGSAAAQSHTGAMVGAFELRESVLRAGGVVSTPSLQTLEDALRLAARHGLPAGPRLAALTFSGGACTIIADTAVELGVELPDLDAGTRGAIQEHVPAFAAVRNPLDVSYQLISSPDRFEAVLAALAGGNAFDAVLLQFTTNADPGATAIAEAAVSLLETTEIPVYLSRYGGDQLAPAAMARYRDAAIPVLDAPDRAMRAVAALVEASRWQAQFAAGTAGATN